MIDKLTLHPTLTSPVQYGRDFRALEDGERPKAIAFMRQLREQGNAVTLIMWCKGRVVCHTDDVGAAAAGLGVRREVARG